MFFFYTITGGQYQIWQIVTLKRVRSPKSCSDRTWLWWILSACHRAEVWTQTVLATTSYCITIIVSDVVNSTRWMGINHLLFLEDSCRCSLQHAGGHSVQAAEARCHTGPATTSQCSVPRACRGRCHTHWCRPHTDAPQTLEVRKRTSVQCYRLINTHSVISMILLRYICMQLQAWLWSPPLLF